MEVAGLPHPSVVKKVVRKPLRAKELSAFLSCMGCAEVEETKVDRRKTFVAWLACGRRGRMGLGGAGDRQSRVRTAEAHYTTSLRFVKSPISGLDSGDWNGRNFPLDRAFGGICKFFILCAVGKPE